MPLGLLFATFACLLWGTIFIVPLFLPSFSAMEVALGRYFTYGLFSISLITAIGPKKFLLKYSKAVWNKAILFGILANVIYYIGIVVGVRYATAPVTVLITGLCPIVAAVYGNWKAREIPIKPFLLSCITILLGIFFVNMKAIDWSFSASSFQEYILGLCGGLTALLIWAWFAVQNALFLKKNPHINRFDWTTMIGASTFFWVILLGLINSIGPYKTVDFSTFFQKDVLTFFLGTSFLGIICGWLGGLCWNKASTILPVSIIGPFIICETIFGIIFAFLYEMRMPSLIELLGMTLMLGGITYCVLSFQRKALARK